jgi:hypothetical protein
LTASEADQCENFYGSSIYIISRDDNV